MQFFLTSAAPDNPITTESYFLGQETVISGINGDFTTERTITLTLPTLEEYNYFTGGVLAGVSSIVKLGMIVNVSGTPDGEDRQIIAVDEHPAENNANLDDKIVASPEGGAGWDTDSVSVYIRPDLYADNISFDVGNQDPGGDVEVTVDIINRGLPVDEAFTVRYYISRDGTFLSEDYLLGTYTFENGIGGVTPEGVEDGIFTHVETITETFTLPDGDDPFWEDNLFEGTYHIGTVINFERELLGVGELEYNNANEGLAEDYGAITINDIGFPEVIDGDLVATAFNVDQNTANAADGVTVDFTIENTGTETASSVDVAIYISDDQIITTDDGLLDTFTITNLTGGTTTSVSDYGITLPDEFGGVWVGGGTNTYYLGIIVDPNDLVVETDETNNRNLGLGVDQDTLDVTVPAAPDLVGSNFDVLASQATQGNNVTVRFNVLNDGDDPVGAFDVAFYLSSDSDIDAAEDRLLTTYSVAGGLAANTATGNIDQLLSLPDPGDPFWTFEGTYYIGMIVDSGDTVAELNDLNNRNVGNGTDRDGLTVRELDLAGGTRNTAYNLGRLRSSAVQINEAVGPRDGVDFYRFVMRRDGRVFLNVSIDSGDANIRLIRESPLAILGESNNSGTANEGISRRLPRGEYFLKIYRVDTTQKTEYTLTARANYGGSSTSTASLAANATSTNDSAGETRASAYNLGRLGANAKTLSQRVDASDPRDVFRFEMQEVGQVSLEVTPDSGNVGFRLYKEGSSRVLAQTGDAASDGQLLRRLGRGTYYLSVYAVGATPASYQLAASAGYDSAQTSPIVGATGGADATMASAMSFGGTSSPFDTLGGSTLHNYQKTSTSLETPDPFIFDLFE